MGLLINNSAALTGQRSGKERPSALQRGPSSRSEIFKILSSSATNIQNVCSMVDKRNKLLEKVFNVPSNDEKED